MGPSLTTTSPWLDANSFRNYSVGQTEKTLTLNGTVAKTVFLMLILSVGAGLGVWLPHMQLIAKALEPPFLNTQGVITARGSGPNDIVGLLFWAAGLGSLLTIMGFIAWFCLDWFVKGAQVVMACAFVLVQGMCMGASVLAAETRYPGVAIMAATATCVLLAVLLGLFYCGVEIDMSPWNAGLIAGFAAALASLFVIPFLALFGNNVAGVHQGLFACWAVEFGLLVYFAQSLLRSFGYIADGIEMGAPKWMEWRAALGLVWAVLAIYISMLWLARNLIGNQSQRARRF